MPILSGSVGLDGINNAADVAVVQAMLRVSKNPKNQPYVSFPYDGLLSPGGATFKAIQALQRDYPATIATPPDVSGKIQPTGLTISTLAELATHKGMMAIILNGRPLVYLAGSEAAVQTNIARVNADTHFRPDFKMKLASLMRQMYDTYKMVLLVIPDEDHGGFRSFAEQRVLMDKIVKGKHVTKSGPGESNHNFGNGADVGFLDFTWVKGSGEVDKTYYWLNSLEDVQPNTANEMWMVRNRLTLLFPSQLAGDMAHLQTFDDGKVSMVKSLAFLLSKCGRMYWDYKAGSYHSNFGLADSTTLFPVGNAKDIWDGKVNVSEKSFATALNEAIKRREAAGGKLPDYEEHILQKVLEKRPADVKEFKPADIKKADCDLMRGFFKDDFDFAEASYLDWKPVDNHGVAL
jgi:hypothetical protein